MTPIVAMVLVTVVMLAIVVMLAMLAMLAIVAAAAAWGAVVVPGRPAMRWIAAGVGWIAADVCFRAATHGSTHGSTHGELGTMPAVSGLRREIGGEVGLEAGLEGRAVPRIERVPRMARVAGTIAVGLRRPRQQGRRLEKRLAAGA